MASIIQPGQPLTITNPDYGVQQEDWIVLAVTERNPPQAA